MSEYWNRDLKRFLRGPTTSWMRSAYAIEVTPWTTKGDIEAALLFRGTIVSAYGYVETRLGELGYRCSAMPEYCDIEDQFPYRMPSRLSFLRRCFAGVPLVKFQDTAERFFIRFEGSAKVRHLAAHARMQVLPDWGATFHDFYKPKGEHMNYRTQRYKLRDLEKEAFRAAMTSRLCQRLADDLEAQQILPELGLGEVVTN
jgi:hypothetical protein